MLATTACKDKPEASGVASSASAKPMTSAASGSVRTPDQASPQPAPPKPAYEKSKCVYTEKGELADPEDSVPRCERECDAGKAHACKLLADMMTLKQVPDDPTRRAKYQGKACDGGVLAACNALARQYGEGVGVAIDVEKAHSLWTKACQGGYGSACWFLGHEFVDADGVPQDFDKAGALFKRGCELGDKNSCESQTSLKSGRFPTLITFAELALNGSKWDGKAVQLRNVEMSRLNPQRGSLRPWRGKAGDFVKVRISDLADDEEKRHWMAIAAPGRTMVRKVAGTVSVDPDSGPTLLVQELQLENDKP